MLTPKQTSLGTPQGYTEPVIGQNTAKESSISNWIGPYVTEMLGKGAALSNKPYEAYGGPLTAGPSALQNQAFQGVANLTVPTEEMGTFTPSSFTADQASNYMNPFVQQSLDPQLKELQRQQEIKRVANAGRLTKAGAYGGGRQAIMDSELDRAGLDTVARVTGKGYSDAFTNAQTQFNRDQDFGLRAQQQRNQYGLDALGRQASLGATQQGITGAGIAADKKQFEEEREFPYKNTTYMQSLLGKLPMTASNYGYADSSDLMKILAGASALTGNTGTGGGGVGSLLSGILGNTGSSAGSASSGLLGALFGDSSSLYDGVIEDTAAIFEDNGYDDYNAYNFDSVFDDDQQDFLDSIGMTYEDYFGADDETESPDSNYDWLF